MFLGPSYTTNTTWHCCLGPGVYINSREWDEVRGVRFDRVYIAMAMAMARARARARGHARAPDRKEFEVR